MQGGQEMGMAEQRPFGQTQVQEVNAQEVEERTCGLGRVQLCCLDVQGWDQESQSKDGTEIGKDAKNNRKGFYK